MVQGKKRTVYLVEPKYVDADGTLTSVPADFWDQLHGIVAELDVRSRSFQFRGRQYRGSARTEHGQRFLYLGKVRGEADLPDVTTRRGSDDVTPLEVDGDVLEYLYAREVGGSSKAWAVLRSSGGASFQALEQWIIQCLDLNPTDRSFMLESIVRKDTLERLAAAQGATKVQLKYEPGAVADAGHGSELGDALRAINDHLGGSVSIEVGLSFGHARPSEVNSEKLARDVQQLVRTGPAGLKKAKAKLVRAGGDGSLVKDEVDFIRDRITYRVEVGEGEDQRPTPEVVLRALADAVSRYREL